MICHSDMALLMKETSSNLYQKFIILGHIIHICPLYTWGMDSRPYNPVLHIPKSIHSQVPKVGSVEPLGVRKLGLCICMFHIP